MRTYNLGWMEEGRAEHVACGGTGPARPSLPPTRVCKTCSGDELRREDEGSHTNTTPPPSTVCRSHKPRGPSCAAALTRVRYQRCPRLSFRTRSQPRVQRRRDDVKIVVSCSRAQRVGLRNEVFRRRARVLEGALCGPRAKFRRAPVSCDQLVEGIDRRTGFDGVVSASWCRHSIVFFDN